MDRKDIIIFVLAVLLIVAGFMIIRQPSRAPVVERNPKGLFGKGRMDVTKGRYEEAIPKLNEYLKKHPKGQNASRARFFLAKAYLGLNQPDQATKEFKAVIRYYPDSLEAHKSRYKLALMSLWEGNLTDANSRFRELVDKPDGPLVPEAQQMIRYIANTPYPPEAEETKQSREY